ncbi:MAG: PASTA domain-containing protein [Acidobacteriota bacterium]|nr:PASTA domain-containing protein [Acidobacteriota bacterium]
MANNDPLKNLEVLSAPLGDIIAAVGQGVAQAQQELDAATLDTVKAIYEEGDDRLLGLLRDIGYQPTWYTIPEVTGEVSMSLTIGEEKESTSSGGLISGRGLRLYGSPMNASYTNKFNMELKAASSIKFRIVPVPPSPSVEQLRVAPALIGKTLAEAGEILDRLDISFVIQEGEEEQLQPESKITRQDPEQGQFISPGRDLVLSFIN